MSEWPYFLFELSLIHFVSTPPVSTSHHHPTTYPSVFPISSYPFTYPSIRLFTYLFTLQPSFIFFARDICLYLLIFSILTYQSINQSIHIPTQSYNLLSVYSTILSLQYGTSSSHHFIIPHNPSNLASSQLTTSSIIVFIVSIVPLTRPSPSSTSALSSLRPDVWLGR